MCPPSRPSPRLSDVRLLFHPSVRSTRPIAPGSACLRLESISARTSRHSEVVETDVNAHVPEDRRRRDVRAAEDCDRERLRVGRDVDAVLGRIVDHDVERQAGRDEAAGRSDDIDARQRKPLRRRATAATAVAPCRPRSSDAESGRSFPTGDRPRAAPASSRCRARFPRAIPRTRRSSARDATARAARDRSAAARAEAARCRPLRTGTMSAIDEASSTAVAPGRATVVAPNSFSASRTSAPSMSASTPSRSHPIRSAIRQPWSLFSWVVWKRSRSLRLIFRVSESGRANAVPRRFGGSGTFVRSVELARRRQAARFLPSPPLARPAAVRTLAGDVPPPSLPPAAGVRQAQVLRVALRTVGHLAVFLGDGMDRITRIRRRRRVRVDGRERNGCQRCEQECVHGNLEAEFERPPGQRRRRVRSRRLRGSSSLAIPDAPRADSAAIARASSTAATIAGTTTSSPPSAASCR